MTETRDDNHTQLAIKELPQLVRRLATAMAAQTEGDCCALRDFARWADLSTVRVHALVILTDALAEVAGWTPDNLRSYATAQEGTRGRRTR